MKTDDLMNQNFGPTTPNLRQKLCNVKKAIGTIAKAGTAPQVMGGYSYVRWEDVSSKVGDLLAEAGIVPLMSISQSELSEVGRTSNDKPIYRAQLQIELRLLDADSDETLRLTWAGTGDDSSDKSVQKAATSAAKYLYMKLFMIAEPDEDSEAVPANGADGRPAVSDACEECAKLGWKSRSKDGREYAAKFWQDSKSCNGRSPVTGAYANHPRPAESIPDVEPEFDENGVPY